MSLVIRALMMLAVTSVTTAPHAEEIRVHLSDIEDRKAVFGTVTSVERTRARTRIGGTLAALSVDEGDRVKAGQPIAEVIDPKLKVQVEAIDARLAALKAEQALARTELDRLAKLRRTEAVSVARYDEARTRGDVLRANAAALEAERKLVQVRMAEGDVISPAAGRVLDVPVTAGTYMLPGETVAVIATERYIIRLELPERHAQSLSAGERVDLGRALLRAGDDRSFKTGTIRQVYPEMRQGRVVADVEADNIGDFFVGERVHVRVVTGTRKAVLLPPKYIVRRSGISFVALKPGGEVVVQTGPIHKGPRGTPLLEILSGLRAGDVVVAPENGG